MIKKLQKNISTLLLVLFSIIWVGILFLYVNTAYRNNLMDIKQDVLSTVKQVRWKNFVRTQGTTVDLSGIPYCVYTLDDANEPHILFHTFPNKSDAALLKIGQAQAQNYQKFSFVKRYASIYHMKRRRNECYMLTISGGIALKATLPTILLCCASGFAGIVLFALSSRFLSRWLVKPIEDTINAEKKFISNASHELKTPLAVISANTELLSSEIGADNKHLTYIAQETSRMIALVQKMLTLTRLDAPQLQEQHAPFSVDEALFDIIYPMESVAYEKHLSLETDIEENMEMDGNKDQIQNLVSILLNNAISYTPEHGGICIAAKIHNRKFCLSVENTGEAIPEDLRDRLFERFFRADEAREDNGHFGLGLSIAKSIVTNHCGKITVERHGDKNVFSVILPVACYK